MALVCGSALAGNNKNSRVIAAFNSIGATTMELKRECFVDGVLVYVEIFEGLHEQKDEQYDLHPSELDGQYYFADGLPSMLQCEKDSIMTIKISSEQTNAHELEHEAQEQKPQVKAYSEEVSEEEDEQFQSIEKQARYKREDGTDTIDKWAEEYTPERFRHVMWAQVDKYHDRLGKKDPIAQEVRKMADYMNRWALVEEGRE